MALEVREYEYMVGGIPTTAMLTEKMAQRLGAKPVGEHSGDPEYNKTAERMSTHGRETDDEGADVTYADGTTAADAATKARTARNKRAS
jgi:hypothetical protein